jgi:O-antigen ligase
MLAIAALLTSFSVKDPTIPKNPLSKLMVFYGVVVLLSSVFGYNPSDSFSHLSDYFNWVIIYFAIVRSVRTKTQFFIFFLLYMLCNFKMTQHGFLSWAKRGFQFDPDGVGGSPGWFQNSGEFGIQLCIFTPLIVVFILGVRRFCNRYIRIVLYIVPVTALASTVASSARAALIGLAAAALWSVKTTKYFFKTLLIGSMLASIVYFSIPEESMQRFQKSGSDRTSLHRLDRWAKGWETMKEHPLLGIGHKNWVQYYHEHLEYGEPGTPLVHNIFVESGTEHGFLGVGTLTLLLAFMFIVNKRTRSLATQQKDNFSILIAHGLDAATIGMIISSCFVTVLYYPYVWIHAAFVAALYTSVQPRKTSS